MATQREDPTAARTALVVVADAVSAHLFERRGRRGKLQQIRTLEHPEGRAKERDLTSDVSGDTFDSHGFGRHGIEADYSAKAHELTRFAKSIATSVEELRNAGAFQELVLVAPPKLLGALRSSLSPAARHAVVAELPKRLTDATPEDLAGALEGVD